MPCYSPLKGWVDVESGGIRFKQSAGTGDEMEVACGKCLGCRLDRSRMWAMRITHEASVYQSQFGNSYVTLTYRDRGQCTEEQLENGWHIREDRSLSVPEEKEGSDFQKFMKRLRKELGSKRSVLYRANPEDRKIKFYQCGEYGGKCRHGIDLDEDKCPMCNLGRPHHHACLFNIEFPDLVPYWSNGEIRYTSPTLERIWRYGFVDVGKLEFQSAAYVARYIMKKRDGEKFADHYQNVDDFGEIVPVKPEYSSMSNGIGKAWYEEYKSDCFPSDEVPVPGYGVIKKVPRYYEEMFKEEDAFAHEEVKENRKKFRRDNAEEYTAERLWQKYKVKKAQVELLKRNKV